MEKFTAFAALALTALTLTSTAVVADAQPIAPRIINGGTAKISDAPFIAAVNVPDGYIGQGEDGKPDNWCGGSLISSTKVLTAAHCVYQYDKNLFTINIGSTDRHGGQQTTAKSIWIHPDYVDAAQGNDVAVITLNDAVDAPVATLNDSEAGNKAGQDATVVGWGDTETGKPVDALRIVTVPLVDDASCSGSYSQYSKTSMLCAGYAEGGKDSCQGDSGGPLIAAGKVVGVVSWGKGCALAKYYGLYARVSTYIDLIKAQL